MAPISTIKQESSQQGFTLVEMLVIAPIVIIMIGGFIGVMINMVSDVLVTRDQNALTYEVQDGLNRIEQDTRLTTQFLVTSGTFIAPQGSDLNFSGTAAFSNSNSLIMSGLTTDKNPTDSTRKLIFYAGQPNVCGALQNYNRPFLTRIMYFIKDGSLWRRTVLGNYNTNAVFDDETVCSVPWQRNTCSVGYALATRCQTNDTEVVKNIDTFSVKYFSDPKSTIEIAASEALNASTIEVTINGKKTTVGRPFTATGSIRATKINNIDVTLPVPSAPTVTATVTTTATGPAVIFNWGSVPLSTGYLVSYNINGGAWTNTTVNTQTTSFTVNAARTDTVTLKVAARNFTGNSAYSTASGTIPGWYTPTLLANWVPFDPVNYSTPAYTKTKEDIVVLKGVIRSGTITNGTSIFVLPAGYRPTQKLSFQTDSNGSSSRIDIAADGTVTIEGSKTNAAWLVLDGINFVASTAAYTWTPATFTPNWQDYGAPFATLRSSVDVTGRTHVQGVVKGTPYTDFATLATIPPAQRPNRYMHFPAASQTAGFNFVGLSTSSFNPKGINDLGLYSIQTMFYPGASGAWTNLPMINGWTDFDAVNYPSAQYTKSGDGIVSLKGLIKTATAANAAADKVIGSLPPGYRPKERICITTTAWGAHARVDILPGGDVIVSKAHNGWTSLDPLSFIAEQ